MNSVEIVKALCKERKVPISKLEKTLGFGNGYISQLKKGTFPSDRLSLIAEFFNVSVSYLIGEEKEKPTPSGEQISEARKQFYAALDDMTDEELLFLMSKIKAIKEMRG